ncbi:MAG: hypothetical protein ACK2UH_18690 [Candidatus Promineifilaceae bacterium]
MRPMKIPAKIAGLRWLTVVVGLYGIVWVSLEGALWQVLLLAAGFSLLGVLYLLQRLLGGRRLSTGRWLFLCAALGCAGGLGCVLLALFLMSVKTGLHGHGPEFAPAEIEWLFSQMPLWATSGAVGGLGLGMLALAFRRR